MDAFKTWHTFTQTKRVDVMLSHARRDEIRRHSEQVRQITDERMDAEFNGCCFVFDEGRAAI